MKTKKQNVFKRVGHEEIRVAQVKMVNQKLVTTEGNKVPIFDASLNGQDMVVLTVEEANRIIRVFNAINAARPLFKSLAH